MTTNSSSIERLQFYTRKATWQRLDVLPFATAYVAALGKLALSGGDEPSVVPRVSSWELSVALLALCVIANAVVFLSTFWSVAAEALVTCVAVADPKRATMVRVTPKPHRGRAVITPLVKFKPSVSTALMVHDPRIDGTVDQETGAVTYFEYQRRVFKYDAQDGVFRKPSYPLQNPLVSYAASEGYDSEDSIKACVERYAR